MGATREGFPGDEEESLPLQEETGYADGGNSQTDDRVSREPLRLVRDDQPEAEESTTGADGDSGEAAHAADTMPAPADTGDATSDEGAGDAAAHGDESGESADNGAGDVEETPEATEPAADDAAPAMDETQPLPPVVDAKAVAGNGLKRWWTHDSPWALAAARRAAEAERTRLAADARTRQEALDQAEQARLADFKTRADAFAYEHGHALWTAQHEMGPMPAGLSEEGKEAYQAALETRAQEIIGERRDLARADRLDAEAAAARSTAAGHRQTYQEKHDLHMQQIARLAELTAAATVATTAIVEAVKHKGQIQEAIEAAERLAEGKTAEAARLRERHAKPEPQATAEEAATA